MEVWFIGRPSGTGVAVVGGRTRRDGSLTRGQRLSGQGAQPGVPDFPANPKARRQ